MISPISSDLSLSCAQLYHHLRTRSNVIPLYLSVPWSSLNTEYSVHQVQHHPMIDSLPRPASFPSLGGWGCTKLSTLPQSRVNKSIGSQQPLRLTPHRPLWSTPPKSLDHSLLVHLQTRSISLAVHLWVHSISVPNCISNLAWSRPRGAYLSSLDLGHQEHLQIRSLTAMKCVSEFTGFWPPNASLSSLDLILQVHLSTRPMMTSKYIINQRPCVYGESGVSLVDWETGSTYSADTGVDWHHPIFIPSYDTTKIHTLSFPTFSLSCSFRDVVDLPNCVDSHSPVVSYALTVLLVCLSKNRASHKFCLDVARGVAEGRLWAHCRLAPLYHHNGLQVVPIILDYHLWPDWPYVYI